jgi:hypothetical protein
MKEKKKEYLSLWLLADKSVIPFPLNKIRRA